MTETLIDIVIPVHDQAPWVDLCLRAVEHQTSVPFRLIIVDNASVDPATHAVLRAARARGHTVINLPENRSFANALNVGAAAGRSPHIVFLNDDAIVTEGWAGALLQDLTSRDVGLVGARSNYVSGAQGDPSFIGEPPWLVFVCVALRRKVWETVGPMDEETFDGFSSEDIDYSWRVVKAGLKLKVSSAFVLHAGSRTLMATTGDAARRAANDAKYNLRLRDKWGDEWCRSHTKLRDNLLIVSFHYGDWTLVTFKDAMLGLKRSDGTSFAYNSVTRAPIGFARNKVADFALDQGFDVVGMLDDDAEFPPDLVRRMLSHRKDFVTALAYQRKPPHAACIYEDADDGQLMATAMVGAERTGLRRVSRTGLHVAFIRTSVFKRMRDAGIRQYFGGFANQLGEDQIGEDMAFSLNCRKVGVQPYCDTDLVAPHMGGPLRIDEAYAKAYQIATAPPAPTYVPAQIDGHPVVVER